MQLNEHDANQGAQSKGEFLGMTGNSGWYLLGSAGASILIVIFCWGVLGVSLLLCLVVGVILCALALAYVFALKNNRPDHYDTDFLESALVDAGLIELVFGPCDRRIANPFASEPPEPVAPRRTRATRQQAPTATCRQTTTPAASTQKPVVSSDVRTKTKQAPEESVVPLAAYEHLRDELAATEEWLEDALVERGEI